MNKADTVLTARQELRSETFSLKCMLLTCHCTFWSIQLCTIPGFVRSTLYHWTSMRVEPFVCFQPLTLRILGHFYFQE